MTYQMPTDPFEGKLVKFRLPNGKEVGYVPTIGSEVLHRARVQTLIDLMLDAPDDLRFYAAARSLAIEVEANRKELSNA